MPRKVSNMNSFFELPNQGLRTYLGSVVKGQKEVYDTPFAKGESTKSLLSSWNDVLVSISDEWPSLYEFEKDMASKVGPLSVRLPLSERMDDIEAYYTGIHLPTVPINDAAVQATIDEWNQSSTLRVRNQEKTVQGMRLSTNSGSPYFNSSRREVLRETVPCSTSIEDGHAIQWLPTVHYDACAVLGWRGQEGGHSKEDVKQRVVWMFPFAVNVAELQVYQPLIEYAQMYNIVPAWVSNERVDEVITKLFDTKGSSDLVVATDFTKFDQHFNHSLQHAAETILKARFNDDMQMRSWLNGTFPIKYMIPLCYNWGQIKTGDHGMGSGSGGTNADETLAHRSLQYEAAIDHGQVLNPNSQCLGDDGILSYPGITVEDVVQSYTKHGLEMNDSKQYASTHDTIYLRRWHHKDYRLAGIMVGVYSTNRALGRLRYLERFMDPVIWDARAVALRQLSILENVKYHPLKEQFVQFCMKRDKYRLGIDIPNFLSNIEREAKEKIKLMPDFLGYRATLNGKEKDAYGIANWWIVKYLKSL